MNPPQLERLHAQMVRLRLFKSRERIEALLQEATAAELSYADFLDQLLTEEVTSKTSKNVTMRTSLARFPFVKSLDAFDFGYQPSIDRKQLQTLASCHFIEHGENVVLLGPPGVGKTHLAVGLGLKAIECGYRVLFTTAAGMITALGRAVSEGAWTSGSRSTPSPGCSLSTRSATYPSTAPAPISSFSSSAGATSGAR